MKWSVYDNISDEVIGIWNDIKDAEEFLNDNAVTEDKWELFPYEELLLPLK
tara:strand:- start:1886 stop:2038 length:153 start_codon:yes stop_codon:yes gene_type:complete